MFWRTDPSAGDCVVRATSCWLLLALAGCSESLPPLPEVSLETFATADQSRVRSAYDRANANPLSPAAVEGLGKTLFAHGRPESAAACFERCLALDPQGFACAYLLGVARSDQGLLVEARAAFERAEGIQWRDIPTSVRLVDLLTQAGELERAREILERVLRMEPSSAAANYRLGTILPDDPDRAIRHLEAAVRTAPGYRDALRSLAAALRQAGRTAEAAEVDARFEQADPAPRRYYQDPLVDALEALRPAGPESESSFPDGQ